MFGETVIFCLFVFGLVWFLTCSRSHGWKVRTGWSLILCLALSGSKASDLNQLSACYCQWGEALWGPWSAGPDK